MNGHGCMVSRIFFLANAWQNRQTPHQASKCQMAERTARTTKAVAIPRRDSGSRAPRRSVAASLRGSDPLRRRGLQGADSEWQSGCKVDGAKETSSHKKTTSRST